MANIVRSIKSKEKAAENFMTDTVDRIQHAAVDLYDKTQEVYDKAKNAVQSVPTIVRKRPVQSLLVGVGVGVLAGLLMNRVVFRAIHKQVL
ncbi:MAG: hypothetical protein AB7F43_13710 [Bacteriovoracia bacterium]